MKYINALQFNEAIKNEDNIFYFVAFNLLFYLGIRRGEMLVLNINDIDFQKNTIRIDETVNPRISNIPTPPKTSKSNRTLPVKEEIMEMLKKIIELDTSTDGYIFLNNIALTTLRRKSNNNLKAIGFNKEQYIRIHDYRHSFASMCINSGIQIEILNEYMGHKNVSITWDTYGHLYPETKSALLSKLNVEIKMPNNA